MPSRYIRDGFLDSSRVNSLEPLAERFYFRLFLVVDDHGRFDARPELLKAKCFPVRSEVRITDITRWLAACRKAGLLLEYTSDARRFLVLTDFRQRCRTPSRYPPPNEQGQEVVPDKCPRDDGHLTAKDEDEDEDEKGAVAREVLIPEILRAAEFLAAWERWLKHRREIRHPLKITAQTALLKKLTDWGPIRAAAAMNYSIENGWTGVFEPGGGNGARRNQNHADRPRAGYRNDAQLTDIAGVRARAVSFRSAPGGDAAGGIEPAVSPDAGGAGAGGG